MPIRKRIKEFLKGSQKREKDFKFNRPRTPEFQRISYYGAHLENQNVNAPCRSRYEDASANGTDITSRAPDHRDHTHPTLTPFPMSEVQNNVRTLVEGQGPGRDTQSVQSENGQRHDSQPGIPLALSCNSHPIRRASFDGCHPIVTSLRAPTLGTPSLQAGPGAFSYARNFSIGTANMIDITQNFNLQNTVLDRLEKKGLLSATLDSQERSYPPRCNPETRRSLRGRIAQWGTTMNHAPDLRAMWLSGPAGVGKSAIAQTVAETFKEDGRLGAAFFFSRPNRREDPDALIPTLAYQLAVHNHEYKNIIARQLADDPSILSQHRRAQFKALIIDPFQLIMNDAIAKQRPNTTLHPLLIIIDGLDECASRQAQREFVRMIADYAGKVDGLGYPLRWLVCSREESHLKTAFANVDAKAIWLRERLEIDDTEAQQDAIRLLESGFAEIRETYGPDRLPADWPPSSDRECIAKAASGHLGFVSFIVRFIGDENYDDPCGQLETCVQFLGGLGAPGALNPLHALDLLYTQILSSIPVTDLHNAMRILGSTILYGSKYLTVSIQADFLGLNQDTFYRALQRLHSVISVPPASEAYREHIRIYHASFSDYLMGSERSGTFALDKMDVHHEVAVQGLRWLSNGRTKTGNHDVPELTGTSKQLNKVFRKIRMFSAASCWKACSRVNADASAPLLGLLESFDFHLDYDEWDYSIAADFACFIRWLHSFGPRARSLISIQGLEVNTLTGDHIFHRDNPHNFLAPFSHTVDCLGSDAIRVQLGKLNPISFVLYVDSSYVPTFKIEVDPTLHFICPQAQMFSYPVPDVIDPELKINTLSLRNLISNYRNQPRLRNKVHRLDEFMLNSLQALSHI
ncbi:hypothetical protein AN958_12794 [Leucoagaricus sp. SymC.cos]|nr:hypothetical protein AN958_12794 [Leucoagaricus sp. SymC.cos]